VFTVRLPAKLEGEAPVAPRPVDQPRVRPVPEGAPTVLVVDDEPAVREIIARTLALDNVRTLAAADGEEGLRMARSESPDLIFLDVIMPKMDGWAVLAALKADAKTADIPVVMVTLVPNAEMGYVLGASEYLSKPLDRERLTAVMRKHRPQPGDGGVLIVEDDEPTREVLRRTLEKEGWTVAEAWNGRDGLIQVERRKPALILLDLMMPEMDGFTFLEEFRRKPEFKDVPVVVLTAKDLTPQERARLMGGVERIVQKGAFSRDALLSEVRRIVNLCTTKSGKLTPCPDMMAVGSAGTGDAASSEAGGEPTPN
jgi:CheY-like chemotaxis protein